MQGADNQGKDARIRKKLRSKDDALKREGVAMTDAKYRYRIGRAIEARFSGLKNDVQDVWQLTLLTLWGFALTGKISKSGDMFPLLWTIAKLHALNIARGNERRIKANSEAVEQQAFHRREMAGLVDLLTDLEPYLGRLTDKQQLVIRTYVQLVCQGHASETGGMPLDLLVAAVNKVSPSSMSKAAVRSVFRTVQAKVIIYLVVKGYYR